MPAAPSSRIAWTTLAIIALLFGPGCKSPQRPGPGSSVLEGIDASDWAEIDVRNQFDDVVLQIARAARERSGPRARITVLALSGGGQNGAFGAGLLAGWPREVDADGRDVPPRPKFDIVTGVSTGALQATSAFLDDPDLDEDLARFYSSVGDDDLFTKNRLLGMLRSSGAVRFEGLSQILEGVVPNEAIDRVAEEYARGRMLWVGTTDLDSGRFVTWNLTYLASRAAERPAFYDLYRRVVLASASIPVAVEPLYIHGSMHVDGGTRANVFLPNLFEFSAPELATGLSLDLFVVMNGKLQLDPIETGPTLVPIAMRAVEVMIHSNSMNSLAALRGQILANSARAGFDPGHIRAHLAFVPSTYEDPAKGVAFDTEYMGRLADFGRAFSREGRWRTDLTENPDP